MPETLLIDDNDLTGNTDAMCEHTLVHFIADCASSTEILGIASPSSYQASVDAEIECECCTLCCADSNSTCNDGEWLANHGGMWETGYSRFMWDFDNGMISPLVDYNTLQLQQAGNV